MELGWKSARVPPPHHPAYMKAIVRTHHAPHLMSLATASCSSFDVKSPVYSLILLCGAMNPSSAVHGCVDWQLSNEIH